MENTQSIHENRTERRTHRAITLALLVALASFHVVNNWLWRTTNTIVFGFDRMFHQVTSLAYHNILTAGINPRTLFEALTWSDYYPPLVHLTVALAYKIGGVSMDVAAMTNTLFLAVLLVAVYGLGEWIDGVYTGLLSAVLVSLLPIVFSMSRYLYIDFALTALVAANICLLLRSNRFWHKGYALLYGLTLGLGMLTKWTFAAFVVAPLIIMLASPSLLRSAWQALRPTSWSGRRLLLGGVIGLALTVLWAVPNLDRLGELPLGLALIPLSWLIWSATLFLALGPSTQGRNLLAALGLGTSIASAWYLTKINFFSIFWLNAYGKPTGRSWGFGTYAGFLVREQLSPLFALTLVVALAGLVWQRIRHSDSLKEALKLGTEGWILVVWPAAAFVIFSSRVSIVHSRYIMPILPPLGIAIAMWLRRIGRRWIRATSVILILVLGLFQFSALTFDALSPIQEAVPFLAEGLSIQLPATARTDPGYWVVPDILELIEAQRQGKNASLGILVNKPQINSKHFIYLTYAQYREIEIKELAAIGWTNPSYPRLFACDFVLSVDPAPHAPRRPETVATIERLNTQPDDTFFRAFTQVAAYPMPDDTQLVLYQRILENIPDTDLRYYESLMTELQSAFLPGDAVAALPAEQIYALARVGDGTLPIYPLTTITLETMEELGSDHSRIWAVLGDESGNALTGWTATHWYQASTTWFGPLQLVLYAPQAQTSQAGGKATNLAMWEQDIQLVQAGWTDQTLQAGQILRLDLHWQARTTPLSRYKIFAHLIDSSGQLISQRDGEPLDGLRPTTSWQPGETVRDKAGLYLPADLAPGDYQLLVGLYDADSGLRLNGCCPAGDAIPIAQISVLDGEVSVDPISSEPPTN